jgi:hypothetical protein
MGAERSDTHFLVDVKTWRTPQNRLRRKRCFQAAIIIWSDGAGCLFTLEHIRIWIAYSLGNVRLGRCPVSVAVRSVVRIVPLASF